ncbi:uncharacterized protein LOC6544137 isoform X2 [Drosophila erecta]|uniref:uncharacterized protein LOC6544137 isoform X2 n=1 Tax=Drosophila erecta TaxID=7220 RepID=UPI000F05D0A9|nr:uncharacterized protein LOC6544137 isoform X2 [Drosophila erecta]
MEISVPPPGSHWSLRFVDILKPFPDQTVANATYKVIRFFYPPFALETVDVTHVVSEPELNSLNVGLFVGFPLFLGCIGYAMYKYARNRPVAKEPPFKLYELEKRMRDKYGPEYKQGIWKRRDIPEPLLLTNDPSEPVAKSKHERGSSKSNNFFIEAHWLPESIENFIKTDRADDKNSVITECNAENRLFDCGTQLDRHSDLAGEIKNAFKERRRKAKK